MSRYHDRSLDEPVQWGNLSPEERIADLLGSIATATHDISEILIAERLPALNGVDALAALTIFSTITHSLLKLLPERPSCFDRDPELSTVINEVTKQLDALAALPPSERDAARDAIERYVAPWALAFHHDIKRLEFLAGIRQRR